MSEVNIIELVDLNEQPTVSNPLEHVVSCEFNKEKALDEFVLWLNESGVSFKYTSKFNDKCPELAKLLDL
jgi:hypothetical protein